MQARHISPSTILMATNQISYAVPFAMSSRCPHTTKYDGEHISNVRAWYKSLSSILMKQVEEEKEAPHGSPYIKLAKVWDQADHEFEKVDEEIKVRVG